MKHLVFYRLAWTVATLVLAPGLKAEGVSGELVTRAPTPSWVLDRPVEYATSAPVEELDGGVYYRALEQQIRVSATGDVDRYQKYSYTLVNQTGVDGNSTIDIEFDPTYQSLALDKLRIHRDGQYIDYFDKARMDVLSTEPELDISLYGGRRTLHVLLEDVRPGDSVEYSYTISGANPVFQGIFSHTQTFEWQVPVQDQFLRLLWGKEQDLYFEFQHSDLEVARSQLATHSEYTVHKRLSKPHRVASETPDWYYPYETLFVSELGSWRDVSAWASPMYRVEPVAEEVRAIADEIASNASTESARIVGALKFVQERIRYVGIEIGENSHLPTEAKETLRLKYGDCKDKVVLLLSLLNALGVEAHAALVNTAVKQELLHRPASAIAFDHVLVTINANGERIWLDPTLSHQLGDLSNLYQPDYGYALVLDGRGDTLTSMQRSGSSDHIWIFERYAIPEDLNKDVDFSVETVRSGFPAMSAQWQLEENGLANLAQNYLVYYRSTYPDLRSVSDLQTAVSQEKGTFSESESYLISNFWEDGEQYLEASFYPAEIHGALYKPEQTRREDPISLEHPNNLRFTIEVKLEEDGWAIDKENFLEDNSFFTLEKSVDFSNKTILIDFNYRSKTDHVGAQDLPEYLLARERALEQVYYGLDKVKEVPDSTNFTHGQIAGISYLVFAVLSIAFFFYSWRKDTKSRPIFEEEVFYPVAPWKFIVLSIVSFSVFSCYWMYRNWKYVVRVEGAPISPLARGVFIYFWTYALFLRLKKDSREYAGEDRVVSVFWAIVLTSLYAISSLASGVYQEAPVAQLFILAPFLLLPFVNYINSRNAPNSPAFEFNSNWKLRHTLISVAMAPIVLIAALTGTPLMLSGKLVGHSDLMSRDLRFFYRQDIVPVGEEIHFFYSDAFLDIHNDGNGFTSNTVFSYWRENGSLQIETADFADVSDVRTSWSTNVLTNTVVTIERDDGSEFILFITPEKQQDRRFVEKLESLWTTYRESATDQVP
ncbi:MAG: DUF3857 domain-containing protein [Pseudomonadota bacterium]